MIVAVFSDFVNYFAKIYSPFYKAIPQIVTNGFQHPNDKFIFVPLVLTVLLNEVLFYNFNFSPEQKYIIFGFEKYYHVVIQIAKLFLNYYQIVVVDIFLIFLQHSIEYSILNIALKHNFSNISSTVYIFNYITEIHVILICIELLYDLYRYDNLYLIYNHFEDNNKNVNNLNNIHNDDEVSNDQKYIVKFTRFSLLFSYDDLKRLIVIFLCSSFVPILIQGIFCKFLFYQFILMIAETYIFMVSLYKDKIVLSFIILIGLFLHVTYYKILLFEYTL